MKLIDKVSRVLFISNILFLLTILIIPFNIELLNNSLNGNDTNLFIGILNLLAILSFMHWIYCLWFQSKFGRYSSNYIWLLIFNGIYAPIYYYRAVIKKKKLQNDLFSENESDKKIEKNEIESLDFNKIMRQGIIDVLLIWSSKEKQE